RCRSTELALWIPAERNLAYSAGEGQRHLELVLHGVWGVRRMVRVVNLLDDEQPEVEVVVYRSGELVVIVINGEKRCAGRMVMPADGDPSGKVRAEVAGEPGLVRREG